MKQGKDWHGWAFWFEDVVPNAPCLSWYSEAYRPNDKPTPNGRWVRVKFVPVDAEAKKAMRRKKVTR